jgi:hypothetical protein
VKRVRLNEHLEADGRDVFHHACKLGLEGIVSKRKDSRYKSGRSPDWVKSKNPNAPAVKRLAEEEWGRWSAASRDVRAGDQGQSKRVLVEERTGSGRRPSHQIQTHALHQSSPLCAKLVGTRAR